MIRSNKRRRKNQKQKTKDQMGRNNRKDMPTERENNGVLGKKSVEICKNEWKGQRDAILTLNSNKGLKKKRSDLT